MPKAAKATDATAKPEGQARERAPPSAASAHARSTVWVAVADSPLVTLAVPVAEGVASGVSVADAVPLGGGVPLAEPLLDAVPLADRVAAAVPEGVLVAVGGTAERHAAVVGVAVAAAHTTSPAKDRATPGGQEGEPNTAAVTLSAQAGRPTQAAATTPAAPVDAHVELATHAPHAPVGAPNEAKATEATTKSVGQSNSTTPPSSSSSHTETRETVGEGEGDQ